MFLKSLFQFSQRMYYLSPSNIVRPIRGAATMCQRPPTMRPAEHRCGQMRGPARQMMRGAGGSRSHRCGVMLWLIIRPARVRCGTPCYLNSCPSTLQVPPRLVPVKLLLILLSKMRSFLYSKADCGVLSTI